MLHWNANFQIPNSGAQAANVFVTAVENNNIIEASFYADEKKQHLLFTKEFEKEEDIENIYDFLLSLEEFSQYIKV